MGGKTYDQWKSRQTAKSKKSTGTTSKPVTTIEKNDTKS
jgi:hypothetical protein